MGAGLHGGFGSTAGFKDAFAFEITVEFTENGYVFRKRKLDRKQIRRRQAEAESRVETASAKNGKKIGSESEKQKRNRRESVRKRRRRARVSFPKGRSQIMHILRDDPGHLTDTPYHRRQIRDLANDKSFYKGKDARGNDWNVKIMRDGSQLWVTYRNGVIQNCGRNKELRDWNEMKGLSRIKPKRKAKEEK